MAKLYVIKATKGREEQVLDFIASKAKKRDDVYSVFHPQGMTGYIIVEAEELASAREVAYQVPYAKGVLQRELSYADVESMIEFKVEDIDINTGDTVRIIAGPFRGEKARVTRIDLNKAQLVLELLEAAVPIPVTLGMDSVQVIDRKEESAAA
tara:strand:+ start:407 stop:865 length:459 start_codon:yes stop_codon:yes gene_type:complete